jgi:ElaB/YqjD/DUF883 family membrane-anchored ribosome-binding protein
MERNSNDNFGNQNPSGSSSGEGFGGSTASSGTGSIGSTGGGAGSMGGSGSIGGSDASFSRDASGESGNIADRAKSALSTAGDKLSGAGSSVRDRAGNLKGSIADALESGAERLRQQGAGGGQIAGAAATGGAAGMIADDNRLAEVSNQVAGGLQASADWLRDADIDGLKTSLEGQVKNHPGRTLAVAVGLGYLLGKALRK